MHINKKAIRMSSIVLIALLSVLLALAACSPQDTPAPSPTPSPAPEPEPAPAEPVTLKAATFLPKNMFAVKGITYLVDEAAARSGGALTVEYLGGPEVIPAFDQAEAVRNNIIQISVLPTTHYEGIVPLGGIPGISMLSPEKEESSGALALMDELHQKAGLKLLWRSSGSSNNDSFQPVLTKKIATPQEFSKIKMGATATFMKPFLDSVGASLTIIPPPEAYTSLERGVVDGFVWPLVNSTNLSFWEVCDYALEPAFMAGNAWFIMNLDAWNALPADMQTLIMDIVKDQRQNYQVEWDNQVKAAKQKAIDNGMEFISFSPDDAEWYFNAIYETAWDEEIAKRPDTAPQLKELLFPAK